MTEYSASELVENITLALSDSLAEDQTINNVNLVSTVLHNITMLLGGNFTVDKNVRMYLHYEEWLH